MVNLKVSVRSFFYCTWAVDYSTYSEDHSLLRVSYRFIQLMKLFWNRHSIQTLLDWGYCSQRHTLTERWTVRQGWCHLCKDREPEWERKSPPWVSVFSFCSFLLQDCESCNFVSGEILSVGECSSISVVLSADLQSKALCFSWLSGSGHWDVGHALIHNLRLLIKRFSPL